jgi:nucleotide-binding universal stress UspA family protein
MTPISRILCPIDFSEGSRHALAQAAAVARAYSAGLTVMHAFVNRPAMDLPPLMLAEVDRQRLIEDMQRFADTVAPGLRPDCRVEDGVSAWEAILDAVDDLGPDLLVMGTHGRSGFRRLFLGSVTEKVVRTAPCPTLVVPPRVADGVSETPAQFRRVLCAVDLSDSSLAALARAFELAQQDAARLLVVYVAEMPSVIPEVPPAVDLSAMATRAAEEARRRLQALIPAGARPYCTIETPIVCARPRSEIVRLAARRRADLIVMGVHGRGVMDLIVFGSTMHHVLRAAPCPVLVVHSEEGAAACELGRCDARPVESQS